MMHIKCEEGLGMHDSIVDVLKMIVFMLVAVLLSADADDSLEMAGFELTVHFHIRDGLWIYDLFLIGQVLECCCGGCSGLAMGQCSV